MLIGAFCVLLMFGWRARFTPSIKASRGDRIGHAARRGGRRPAGAGPTVLAQPLGAGLLQCVAGGVLHGNFDLSSGLFSRHFHRKPWICTPPTPPAPCMHDSPIRATCSTKCPCGSGPDGCFAIRCHARFSRNLGLQARGPPTSRWTRSPVATPSSCWPRSSAQPSSHPTPARRPPRRRQTRSRT